MIIDKTIKFLLHKRNPGDTKNLGIRMRVTIKGQTPMDFPFPKTLKIDSDDWDFDTMRPKSGVNTAVASDINRTIGDWVGKMNDVFARYEIIEMRIPANNEVKQLFNDYIGKKSILDANDMPGFFDVFDMFTQTMGDKNEWTAGTHEKFHALRNHLEAFDKKLDLATFDEAKAQLFVSYLHGLNFRNTTVKSKVSFLKWFLRWAATSGFYPGHTHDTFKPKLKGTSVESKEIIYLTKDEVKCLEEMTFTESQSSLERVRDVFLFCCFTGLRYSDVKKLTRYDIRDGVIVFVTKKTVDGIRVELNKHSQAILDKYANVPFPGNMALPVISNEKMNARLKDLGKLAGFDTPTRLVYFQGNTRHEEIFPKWQLMTTHVARRTFVVNALRLGIPPEVIMRWTGHSSFEAMKPYMKIIDEVKRTAMSRFDDF